MSTLKELKSIFRPEMTSEAIAMACVVIVVGSFLGFEVYAFATIMQNPLNLDNWAQTEKIDKSSYLTLRNSILFSSPMDLEGYTIFVFRLKPFENKNITVHFNATNCAVEKVVYASVKEPYQSDSFRFVASNMRLLNISTIYSFTLRDMSSNDFDVLFIKTLDIAVGPTQEPYVQLYNKVSLNDS